MNFSDCDGPIGTVILLSYGSILRDKFAEYHVYAIPGTLGYKRTLPS